jgi:hypothetical protein
MNEKKVSATTAPAAKPRKATQNAELGEEVEQGHRGRYAGIDALISVTQMKVDNANDNALNGASKQTGSHWFLPRYTKRRKPGG